MLYENEATQPEDYFKLGLALDLVSEQGYFNKTFFKKVYSADRSVIQIIEYDKREYLFLQHLTMMLDKVIIGYNNMLYIFCLKEFRVINTIELDSKILSIHNIYSKLVKFFYTTSSEIHFETEGELSQRAKLIVHTEKGVQLIDINKLETRTIPISFIAQELSVAYTNNFVIIHDKVLRKLNIFDSEANHLIREIDNCHDVKDFNNPIGTDKYEYTRAIDLSIHCNDKKYHILGDKIITSKEYLDYYGIQVIGRLVKNYSNTYLDDMKYFKVRTKNNIEGTMSKDLSVLEIGNLKVPCPFRHDLIIDDLKQWRGEQ